MKTKLEALVVIAAMLAIPSVPMYGSDSAMFDGRAHLTYENPFGWSHATVQRASPIYRKFLSPAAGEESRVGGERIRYTSAIPDGAEIPEVAVYDSPRIGMSTHVAPMVVSSPADPRLLEKSR